MIPGEPAHGGSARFDRVRAVADAVLLEGYLLYPYRASATKNRYRWTFGVVAPRAWSETGGCEPWWIESQCLLQPGEGAVIEGRLRFLQVRQRRVERREPDGTFQPTESLEVAGELYVSCDEADVCEIPFRLSLPPGRDGGQDERFEVPGGLTVTALADGTGDACGRVAQERWPVRGRIRVRAQRQEERYDLVRLSIRVENDTAWEDVRARRDEAVRASLVATHLLLAVEGGAFVSVIDPPGWAEAAARACRSKGSHPVLAGLPGTSDLVLSAPIILYDHPQLAPESPGDFFDATEIDELLTLRTATLTDEEKREARATDPRAAALVDRVDGLPRELLARLHGAVRDFAGPEMVPLPGDHAAAPRARFGPGQRVRLRLPEGRRTDAQDVLYAGRIATIHKVVNDVRGEMMLAVTIDGDPAAELHSWYGRYHYYRLDEVDLLDRDAGRAEAAP